MSDLAIIAAHLTALLAARRGRPRDEPPARDLAV